MLCITNTLYHDLRPVVLFGALGCALKELILVLAPNADVRTHGRLLARWRIRAAGLELLEVSLEGISDEVRGCPPPALALTDRYAII